MTVQDSPIFKEVHRKADDYPEVPDVSLFVMAKNAESCIGRLLANVGPYIKEVVMVLNDCTDSTQAIVERWCDEQGKSFHGVSVTADSHPDLYLLDTAATYQAGRSLVGEEMSGPFMEKPILADWASARNLGWNLCTHKWRLFLDSDDTILDPWALPAVCAMLEEHGLDLACSIYQFNIDDQGRPRASSLRERIARNIPSIQWTFPIHENLLGDTHRSHLMGNLIVVDHRDNSGIDVRIPGRNFKILYHQARSADWEVSPRVLSNLLTEVRHLIAYGADFLDFATELFNLHASRSTWPEELAWACVQMGEIHEKREEYKQAEGFYRKSLEYHPGAKAAFRLSRVLFSQQDWDGCIAMHELGVANQQVHHVLDDGAAYEGMGKILAAGSCLELGWLAQGLKYATEALVIYPTNSALASLKENFEVRLALE